MTAELLSSAAARYRRRPEKERTEILEALGDFLYRCNDPAHGNAAAVGDAIAVLEAAAREQPKPKKTRPRKKKPATKKVKRSKIDAKPKGALSNWLR